MTMKKVFICSPYRGDVERNVALKPMHDLRPVADIALWFRI